MIADGDSSQGGEPTQPPSAPPGAGFLSVLLTREVGAPLAAAVLVVVVAALATATALRPSAGFRSGLHLLGALALGASAAVLALLAAAALAAAARKRNGRQAPPMRMLALAGLAAALLLGASVQALRTGGSTSTAPARSAAAAGFARWQQRVVPIVVSYVSVVRADGSLLRSPPRTGQQTFRAEARARADAATLRNATATLARVPSADASLDRLTRRLRISLTLAQRGHAAAAAALAADAARRRSLLADARRALRNSQQAMAAFTLGANALGAQLNAQP